MKSEKDAKRLWRKRYARIASEEHLPSSCTGDAAIESQAKSTGYSEDEIKSVPESALMGLGCHNPVPLAELKAGEIVLDLGAGGGLDVFLAAQRVGEKGKVIGVDITPEMVEKARENARKGGYKNVEFRVGEIENLPVEDESIDVVISNCVMNHCLDKLVAFKEVFRCLRGGGRMLISDLVVEGEFSNDLLSDEVWGQWLAGALGKQEYLNAIIKAEFRDVGIVVEKPFYMSEKDHRLKGKIISIQVRGYK